MLKQPLVFGFVCFAWIFFRSASVQDAATIITRMFTTGGDPQFPLLALLLVLAVWCYQWLYESKGRGILERPAVRVTLVVAMALYLLLVPGAGEQAFIYFQFWIGNEPSDTPANHYADHRLWRGQSVCGGDEGCDPRYQSDVTLVDISHSVRPQDIPHGALVLEQATWAFPADTIHIAVVDPGVGSSRQIILARTDKHYFIAPDNGLMAR